MIRVSKREEKNLKKTSDAVLSIQKNISARSFFEESDFEESSAVAESALRQSPDYRVLLSWQGLEFMRAFRLVSLRFASRCGNDRRGGGGGGGDVRRHRGSRRQSTRHSATLSPDVKPTLPLLKPPTTRPLPSGCVTACRIPVFASWW